MADSDAIRLKGVRGNAMPESFGAAAKPGKPGQSDDRRVGRGAPGAGYAGANPSAPLPAATPNPGEGGGASGGEFLLIERELKQIELEFSSGLTSHQLLDLFQQRGIKLSEATFRKYVQLGLLPRCVRVGKKGLHQGSQGIYPAATVRRINTIKRMMSDGATIEEIQRSFIRWKDEIEAVHSKLRDLLAGFEKALKNAEIDAGARKEAGGELADAKRVAADLIRRIDKIERLLASPLDERPTGGQAAGGAEELL